MSVFNMKIAAVTAEIHCLFESTQEYFRKYVTEECAEFIVCICAENLTFEQWMLDEEADRIGLRRRKFTDPFLERTSIQREIAKYLLNRNVLLLHGSTVALEGAAYLFTARCGVGKSTHTRLWRECFGDRAVVVNDDRAFLQLDGERILAYGSPWSGKHGLDSNICVPLAGICILERGSENRIRRMDWKEALPLLLEQVCVAGEEPGQHQALTAALAQAIPLWKMDCTKDLRAAQISYAAMSGKESDLSQDDLSIAVDL